MIKPVAWTSDLEFDGDTEVIPASEKGKLGTDLIDIPLYTTPPQREWQGLTDEEVRTAYCTINDKEWAIGGMSDAEPFARTVEATLKEKNT